MSIQFRDLVVFFEEFATESRGFQKYRVARNFMRNVKEQIRLNNKSMDDCVASLYSVIRLILPGCDRGRPPYGIKKYKFSKILLQFLRLPESSVDAMLLLNFRGNKMIDFAEAAYFVLQKYYTVSIDQSMTVAELHKCLDAIADENTYKDPRGLEAAVMYLFNKCGSSKFQQWIIRIILKDMHLGMGHRNLLTVVCLKADELFESSRSLMEVCRVACAPMRLAATEIGVFKPLSPMRSKECDITVFMKDLPNTVTLYIEKNFCGERIHLHMRDNNFRYFSSNGFDYTEQFGATYENGIFTPQLKNVFHEKFVESAILDGQMMMYNKQTKKFAPKGMAFDVNAFTTTGVYQPCYCVFDVLYVNEIELLNNTLERRIALLKQIFVPKEGVIVLSEIKEVMGREEVLKAFNASTDREEEGIVVKMTTSSYKPGYCSDYWWKIKLEYFEGHILDVDLLLVGGYYGFGDRFSRKISSFLLAVYDDTEDKFRAFVRVVSEIPADEFEKLNMKIATHWKAKDLRAIKDAGILLGTHAPDLWIDPKDSCVVKVRGTELMAISQGPFATECTLHCPRVLHVITDKLYKDILTVSDLKAPAPQLLPVMKLTKDHITMQDINNLMNVTRTRKRQFFTDNMVAIAEVRTMILQNYEFCILSGSEEWPRHQVQKDILENGGRLTYREGPDTLCVLANHGDPKVITLRNLKSEHNVVKLEWLKRVLEGGKFFHYEPSDCLYIPNNPKRRKLDCVQPTASTSTQQVVSSGRQTQNDLQAVPGTSSDYHPQEVRFVCLGNGQFQRLQPNVKLVVIKTELQSDGAITVYLQEQGKQLSDVQVLTLNPSTE